ncbi:hypothetical protein F4821DRAFT_276501 [Hypoxylon rubiginosum]|uniref:Uncharacterized protein n=1 Tax=Hypoxylon rubiginosum TaxID=110542 RepID=A0ACC0D8N1_9PEZI|nr:hypothetical protein F4821DRAFT_276501 [Hypoxylon rubiginosum]
MQFSYITLFQILPVFLGLTSATPVAESSGLAARGGERISDIINNNAIEWKGDGDTQTATYPARRDLDNSPMSKRGFVGIGPIFGEQSKAECINDGKKMTTDALLAQARKACPTLASLTKQGQAINAAWTFVNQKNVLDAGKYVSVAFGVKKLGDEANPIQFTEALCELVFSRALDGAPCGKDQDSHGAKIQVGNMYELQIDPSSNPNNEKTSDS